MKKTENSDNLLDQETTEKPRKIAGPEVVDRLDMDVLDVCNEYINNLDNPEEIYQNNGLFVDMLKYIYKVYLGDIIGNNKGNAYNYIYDYSLLDKVFYIYTRLVYKYKQNKRPSVLEYTLFTNVSRQTLYNIVYGHSKKATPEDIYRVKKWFTECENQLTNGSSVFEIFLLKSQYRYNDNLAPVPIESQGPALSANELPDFKSCQNTTLTDKKAQKNRKKDP